MERIHRRSLVLVCTALLLGWVCEMRGGSSNDPFILVESPRVDGWNGTNQGYSDVNGRTLRSSVLNTGQKNLVLITAGDSNMGSVAITAYTPTNAAVIDNFNMYDGASYAPSEPLLGSGYFPAYGVGGISGRLADLIVSAGAFGHVTMVPCAVGGSTSGMWAAGGVLYNRLNVVMARLAARGITPSTTNVTFALVLMLGANDHGTSTGTEQANYNQTIAKIQDAGYSGRIFIPSYSIASNTVDANITAAQAAIVDNVNIFAGGNLDSLTGATNRHADGTHFISAGQASAALLIYNAMHASGAPF